ncbi:uncharacterized protein LOC106662377 isoform X2 [Cimex lectularius]|uniref:Uncharacterized protein n=1 Tax=Cimex lectularius TaxID=79782 RepID=A0A8I6RH32_CIMLE|nr:uncharacterized protein LOC106662377 isoform X1 [Cimex lectularius]XP_014241924.1 uncharacterized protein LOC106662377 isoform X1 [Cimex lectularius]XP_024081189.1 uncharacterized protein LOC106662377 isoform X2 [Cimex lectularius]
MTGLADLFLLVMLNFFLNQPHPEKPDESIVVENVEKAPDIPKAKQNRWRALRFDAKRKCIVLSIVQMVISVIYCVTPLIDIFYFSEYFVRRMGIFLGTFLVPTMVTVNTLLYILDIFMQGFFLYAVKEANVRYVQIVTVYSVFSPLLEATRVIICVNFEFIAEVLAFSCALLYRLLFLSTLHHYRRTLSTCQAPFLQE